MNRVTEKIDENCVVICGSMTTSGSSFDKTEKKLEKIGLRKLKELIGNIVFSK